MSFVQYYLTANALFVLAWLLVVGLRAVASRMRRPPSWRHQLHLAYALVAATLVAPFLALPSPSGDLLPMAAQLWSAPSMQVTADPNASPGATVSLVATETSVSLDLLTSLSLAACLAGILVALARAFVGTRAIQRIARESALVARAGSLSILATDDVSVPFSFWTPRSSLIVVPSALIVRASDLRLAIRHEGQHHRNGDTRLIYASELLKGAFFLNPAVHALCRMIHELQEFACDEAVADRRNVSARGYCDCLLWVAQNSFARRPPGSCMRMADDRDSSMLSRRIEAVLSRPVRHLRRPAVLAMNALAVAMLLGTGVVLPGTVQDRRVSLSQAQEMAEAARQGSSFPVVVNEEVVSELNRLLGTPDGRAFLRSGLQRMRDHQQMIEGKLAQYGLPSELLAVPLVESGYRNLKQDVNPVRAAGIWQFIRPTARRFGLTIDEARDDRLDPELETDAAVRMFSQLYAEFADWNLALLAYNGGNGLVRSGIEETGSRDAFELTRRGYINDPNYLPRTMAAIIVLRNEHLASASGL
jgi:membrane-bound lytic murein transglycosylase D